MLFRAQFLDGIRAGKIVLAFRRWKRPTVKAGGTLLTPVGLLAISGVEAIDADSLSTRDARQAGFESLDDLRADIDKQQPQTLYRIRFSLAGDDPRIALRQTTSLTDTEQQDLRTRLRRLDKASRTGPWTQATLRAIKQAPGVRATELAQSIGMETQAFKRNVRKLKGLGLTESLGTGYRLSPRGRAFKW